MSDTSATEPAPRPTPAFPTPEPWVQADAKPFWDAAGEHRLVVPRCTRCATTIWYPKGFCPSCGSTEVEWLEVPGTGTVYSFSVARKGQGAYRDAAPYVLAYVELDLPDGSPGPRVMTNIVDGSVDDVTVGAAVTVVFHDTERGTALPRFRLA